MTLDEAIKRYTDNAEYERTHGSLQGCLEFRQLAEWLKELKEYRERIPSYEAGYNDAKREIVLSGEYERAYERGKADAQNARWIPISERLPEKSGAYWCTFGGTNLTGSDYYTTESDAKEIFGDEVEEYDVGWQSQNVIAWMPLPEPYKTESEE